MTLDKNIDTKIGSAPLRSETLLTGDDGTYQTLSRMSEFVLRDYKKKEFSAAVKKLERDNEHDTIESIFNFVVKNYPFRDDPKTAEFITAPIITLQKASPFEYQDCDDLSMLLAALLMNAGFKVRWKVISWRDTVPKHAFTHVYLIVKTKDGWMPLDPTLKEKGFARERAPINRAVTVDVKPMPKYQKTTLSDSSAIDLVDIGGSVLQRLIKGETKLSNVPTETVQRICQEGFKQRVKENAVTIVVAVAAYTLIVSLLTFLVMRLNHYKRVSRGEK